MKSLSFAVLSLLLACNQIATALRTTTVTVLERPNLTTTLGGPATAAELRSSTTPETSPTTLSHSTKQSSHTTLVTSTSTPKYAVETTVMQATRTEPGLSAASSLAPGAAGTDSSSFNLSRGGLIAIIVVIAVVAIFGAVSITLWILAKRRQWNVRASIKRMSRRLTGRHDKTNGGGGADKRKRSGIVAGSKKPGVAAVKPPGHTRGLVVEVKDVEKGPQTGSNSKKPREKTWIRRLWGNDWK